MTTSLKPPAYKSKDFIDYEMDGPIHASSFINSLVVPRPIALVTTIGPEGVINVAPFSYFNIACTNPAMTSLAIERRMGVRKDTSRNIVEHKQYVVNLCSMELAKSVSIAGGDFPSTVSEADLARLDLIASKQIAVPRVANTLAQLECELFKIIELGNDPTDLILGRIVKVHVHKKLINEGKKIDVNELNPLARVAGSTYARLADFIHIPRGLTD